MERGFGEQSAKPNFAKVFVPMTSLMILACKSSLLCAICTWIPKVLLPRNLHMEVHKDCTCYEIFTDSEHAPRMIRDPVAPIVPEASKRITKRKWVCGRLSRRAAASRPPESPNHCLKIEATMINDDTTHHEPEHTIEHSARDAVSLGHPLGKHSMTS